jgi:lysozyme
MAFSELARSRIARSVGATTAGILISFVPRFEGKVLHTYWDPVPIVTACVGHTDPSLRIGQQFTSEECDQMLSTDLVATADGVRECVKVPLSSTQLAAFVSFAFNVGVPAFCGSSMARKLDEQDYAGACAELSRWTMAGGKVLQGLVRRRAAERAMCEEGTL